MVSIVAAIIAFTMEHEIRQLEAFLRSLSGDLLAPAKFLAAPANPRPRD